MDKGKRKMTKPLVEKRRRARINNSLADLKNLLVAIIQRNGTDFHRSKWEKADILEMAVFHLRRLQGASKGIPKDDGTEADGDDKKSGNEINNAGPFLAWRPWDQDAC